MARSALKQMNSPALLNACAHDARLVLSFKTLAKYRDLSDLLRSTIVSRAPPLMSSIAEPVPYAKSYTLARQEDDQVNDKDASKSVPRHFNLPNHSKQHIAICGRTLHQGTTDSRKNLEQKFIFQIGTLNPYGINERFSFN